MELALAKLLGVAALALSVFVWRINGTAGLWRRLRTTRWLLQLGIASAAERRYAAQAWARLSVSFLVFYATVHLLVDAFRYLELVNAAAAAAHSMDAGLLDRLWGAAELLQQHGVAVGFAAIALSMVDWFIEVVQIEPPERLPILPLGAPHQIPRDWRSAPEALWELRLEEAVGGGVTTADGLAWQRDWCAWAGAVSQYRAAIAVWGARDVRPPCKGEVCRPAPSA